MKNLKNLQNISTHSEYVKWLGMPEHEQYQICWHRFYERYHNAIINHILRKANWSRDAIMEAEEVASMVYEKGFRWSFKKKQGVRFRVVLQRLVIDALSEYFHKHSKNATQTLCVEPAVAQSDCTDTLSIDILRTLIDDVLVNYNERRAKVLRAIWENGGWPKPLELASILGIENDDVEKRKNAAKQWRKRNKLLWSDFQEKLSHELQLLALGDQRQSEVEHFTKINF